MNIASQNNEASHGKSEIIPKWGRAFLLAFVGYAFLALLFVLVLIISASLRGEATAFRYVGF